MSNWVYSRQDMWFLEDPCECDIEPPGFISHGVNVGTVERLISVGVNVPEY